MSKRKKIITWFIRILLFFVILIAVAMFLTPGLINLEMVKENLKEQVSQGVGGEIEYRRLELSYFPRPHVVIHKAEIMIPDSFTIKIHRIKVYPKIMPLFSGSLQIGVITLEYADYFMKLPQISDEAPNSEEILSFDDTVKAISKAIRGLPEFKLPELYLKIKNGRVNLVDPFGRKFKLREVQADYQRSPDELDFSIKCKSNLWDRIDIRGYLNPQDFKGRGHIQLSRFRPQTLIAYLFSDSALQVTDTKANLTIDLELDGSGNLTADFNGAIPFLALRHGEEKLIIKGGRIKGTVRIGDKTAKIILTQLELDYPKLNVTGLFSYDENRQDIRLAIDGTRIDADSVRQVALTLAGESDTIRDIFDIIRGGRVPWMTVRIRGHTIAELGMLDNIVIKGKMTKGKIFIPEVELNLEDVIGDAVISKGILLGENLEARMGNTQGHNGKMTLGLDKILSPFQLKIGVNADLSQLPPVLGRIVEDKDFLNELALIKDVKGSAVGMLTLGDDIENLTATVEVSKAHLSARYERIPYPIKIDGGHFVYTANHIEFDNFKAVIDKSSLLGLSSAIDWAGIPNLKVKSKSAKFDLAELYSWLLSFDAFKKNLKNIDTVNGNVSVQNLNIKGPLFDPRNWRFQTRGIVNDLVVTSKKLPKSLQVTSARFSWQGAQVVFNDVDAAMGKSTISQLSANVDLGKSSSFEVQSKSVKLFSDEIYPWLSSFEKFQPALKNFSATKGVVTLHDLNLKGPFHHPAQWRYDLTCKIQNLVLTSDAFEDPVTVNNGAFDLINKLSAGGSRNKIKVKKANLTWADNHLTLVGGMILAKNDTLLDMTLTADGIDWNQIKHLVDYIKKRKKDPYSRVVKGDLLGTLKVRTDNFNYESFSVHPLHADVSFKPDKVIIAVNEAVVCGISFRGLLNVSEQTLEINLVPTAVKQKLAPAVSCITNQKELATGTYNLNGELIAKSKPDAFLESLSGKVTFSAEKGRIYRFGLLAKILAILNITEIYRGEIPDLAGEGFAYHGMTAGADIKEGKLIMKECSIDGVSMGIACEGSIDLVQKKMDLIVLVAPFKTLDRIVDFIPLVGHIFGGKLISIPFRATGDLKDPTVIPLPPTAVGSQVLGILERTLKLPITIIQPVFTGNNKNKKSVDKNGQQ